MRCLDPLGELTRDASPMAKDRIGSRDLIGPQKLQRLLPANQRVVNQPQIPRQIDLRAKGADMLVLPPVVPPHSMPPHLLHWPSSLPQPPLLLRGNSCEVSCAGWEGGPLHRALQPSSSEQAAGFGALGLTYGGELDSPYEVGDTDLKSHGDATTTHAITLGATLAMMGASGSAEMGQPAPFQAHPPLFHPHPVGHVQPCHYY